MQAGFLDRKNPRFGIKSFVCRIQVSHIEKDLCQDIARVIPIRVPRSVKDRYDASHVAGFGADGIPTKNDPLFDQRWIEGPFRLFESAKDGFNDVFIVVGSIRSVRFDQVETIQSVAQYG